MSEPIKTQRTKWPETSDKEFSKRMFILFMWAFFAQIGVTVILECFFGAEGVAVSVLQICIPVYSTIFAAVIVKGGVENVFKGKAMTIANQALQSSDNENG